MSIQLAKKVEQLEKEVAELKRVINELKPKKRGRPAKAANVRERAISNS